MLYIIYYILCIICYILSIIYYVLFNHIYIIWSINVHHVRGPIGLDPAFRGRAGLGRRDPVLGSYGEIMRIFNIYFSRFSVLFRVYFFRWFHLGFILRWLTTNNYWLVVSPPLKNISHLGWLFPIYGKNVPNHQPV